MTKRIKLALWLVIIGIAINIIFAFTKLFVGLKTNSLCIMLDSTNSFLDIATGIITVIAFCMSAQPKSEKYPFGRGRSEYIAGFIVAISAMVTGGLFLMDSISRIAMPEPVWFGNESCILISVGVPCKIAMAVIYKIFYKKIKSKALIALFADSILDAGITTATVVSFSLSSKYNYAIDSIFGIAIGIIVIAVSIKMVADNLGVLSGKRCCEEERKVVINACKKHTLITKILRIDLHDYGYQSCYGSVQIQCKEDISYQEKTEISNYLRAFLKEQTNADISFICA